MADYSKLAQQGKATLSGQIVDGRFLGVEAEAASSLCSGADPIVGDRLHSYLHERRTKPPNQRQAIWSGIRATQSQGQRWKFGVVSLVWRGGELNTGDGVRRSRCLTVEMGGEGLSNAGGPHECLEQSEAYRQR